MEKEEYRRMAEADRSHWWYEETRSTLRQELAAHLRPETRILDAGCGTGATGGWLTEHGTVTALDYENLAIETYRDVYKPLGVVRADLAEPLPFGESSFDIILSVTVLCHKSITNTQAVLSEYTRVLRPGGIVCLLEPGVRKLRRAHDRVTHTARRFALRDLNSLVDAGGLVTVRSTGVYSFLLPPAAIKAVIERGRTASDLAESPSGLGGVFPALAKLERRWLRNHDLVFGLSVLTIGQKPLEHSG